MKLTAVFEKSQVAARALNMTSDAAINQVLADLADLTEARAASILAANKEDLARMDIANPKYDRLKLTEQRRAAWEPIYANGIAMPLTICRNTLERYGTDK